MEGAIAEAVSPLREKVGEDAADREALGADLTDLVNDMPPPKGTKEVIALSGPWSTDEPGNRNVGVATVVIPDQPRDNKPYCLGVIVDDTRGVLFSTTDEATVENRCAGLGSPDAVVRGAPQPSE